MRLLSTPSSSASRRGACGSHELLGQQGHHPGDRCQHRVGCSDVRMMEAFELPAPVGVPILGAEDAKKDDIEESIARLAFFVAVLAEEFKDKLGKGKTNFILGGITEVLERYGPIDIEHEFEPE